MKKHLLIMSVMFSTATTLLAQGSVIAPIPTKTHGQPNVIECVSDDNTVKLNALIGSLKPLRVTISEKDTSGNWNSLDLGGLLVTNTSVGQLLSGYNNHMADATQAYTLIVPNVVVELGTEKVETFKSILTESWSGGLWFDDEPRLGEGVKNTYISVSCNASFIYFN